MFVALEPADDLTSRVIRAMLAGATIVGDDNGNKLSHNWYSGIDNNPILWENGFTEVTPETYTNDFSVDSMEEYIEDCPKIVIVWSWDESGEPLEQEVVKDVQ